MREDSPPSISPRWLDRLTEIALYSPAVSLLRTYLSLFPDEVEKAWAVYCVFASGHFDFILISHWFRPSFGGMGQVDRM